MKAKTYAQRIEEQKERINETSEELVKIDRALKAGCPKGIEEKDFLSTMGWAKDMYSKKLKSQHKHCLRLHNELAWYQTA